MKTLTILATTFFFGSCLFGFGCAALQITGIAIANIFGIGILLSLICFAPVMIKASK